MGEYIIKQKHAGKFMINEYVEENFGECAYQLFQKYRDNDEVRVMQRQDVDAAIRLVFKDLTIDNPTEFIEMFRRADSLEITAGENSDVYLCATFNNFKIEVR